MKKILPITAVLALIGMTGCFTGVESTPKITLRDVNRRTIADRPEFHVLDSVGFVAPRTWETGKRFFIADSRISRAAWRAEPYDSLAGHTAVLRGFDSVPTLTGEYEMQLNFTIDSISQSVLEIRTGISPQRWQSLDTYSIPHLVDMDMIDAIADRLVGKTYYILSSRRQTITGNDTIGLRYAPVTVTRVLPATEATPAKVVFTDSEGNIASVLMTLGDETKSRRNFETVFALENPRTRYKEISDHVWDLICHSRVETGMTPVECRLALGSPDSYLRLPTTAGMAERWTYTNGTFLYFEDGALSAFRL